MAATLFKTRYLPSTTVLYGDSTTILTNANTVFIDTYYGNDYSGDGTREFPYKSINKAILKSGPSYILFRGIINEYFSLTSGKSIIGDDRNQSLIYMNYTPFNQMNTYRYTVDYLMKGGVGGPLAHCEITCILYSSNSNASGPYAYYSLIQFSAYFTTWNTNPRFYNSTVYGISCSVISTCWNSILYGFVIQGSLTNIVRLNNFIISTTCIFKKTNAYTNLIQPTWTDDSSANTVLIRNAYVAAGMTAENALLMFPQDANGNELTKVVKEVRNGGTHPNIFNRYDSDKTTALNGAIVAGAKTSIAVVDTSTFPNIDTLHTQWDVIIGTNGDVFTYTSKTPTTFVGSSQTLQAHDSGETVRYYGLPLDWTLNTDINNLALTASSVGGFVGAFKPQYEQLNADSDSPINVNADGSDTVDAGTLLVKNADETITFDSGSAQTWNRIKRTATLDVGVNTNFRGIQSESIDGSMNGFYIGKYQNSVDATEIYTGTSLVAGEVYKVFNDTGSDATRAIIHNGVTYMPGNCFRATGTSTFTLVDSESGSYIQKMLSNLIESIEITPYIDEDTPSDFPKFSAPLVGDCKLLTYTAAGAIRYSKSVTDPVLFSDLVGANFVTDFARTGKVATISVVVAGSGYSVGNVLYLATPTGGWAASAYVDSLSGSGVATVLLMGKGYLYTTGTKATTVVPTGGTGCTISVDTTEDETVISDKISYYDDWAVSNADWEYFRLFDPSLPAPKNTYFTETIPVIRYLRTEINGHYDERYGV